jgi:trehalose 6-phosphate phosphatase
MHDIDAVPEVGTLAVFLDMDGTLIDFAPTPGEVLVPPDLVPTLAALLERTCGAMALLSGRSIADLDRLAAPLALPASGLHGGAYRVSPGGSVSITPHEALPAGMRRDLAALVADFPATMLEDKGMSLAVHYRRAPHVAAELGNALRRYVTRGEGTCVEVMAGELVYELKPAGFDKGRSLRDFMRLAPFAGRRPVFVSDHPIDQAGFDAAAGLGGFGISVGRRLPGVAYCLPDPAAVRAWLRLITGAEWRVA